MERVDLDSLDAAYQDGTLTWDHLNVIPELVAELRVARERIADYENAIAWGTSCTSCARILDANIADHERAEKAEAELRVARRVVEDAKGVT